MSDDAVRAIKRVTVTFDDDVKYGFTRDKSEGIPADVHNEWMLDVVHRLVEREQRGSIA